jgi:hypothetical protein
MTGKRGRGRGRPLGSGKNHRAAMDPALRAAITGQDDAHAEKENAYVLSLVTSADEHQNYYSDEGDDDEMDPPFEVSGLAMLPEASQKRSRTSTQVSQSQPSPSQPNSKATGKGSTKPTVKRLKPAINAAELTQQNYDLFARALESKCNNQFQLLNENFKTYTRNQERSTVSIVHILKTINTTLSNVSQYQAYNTPVAKVKSESKRQRIGEQMEPICLDSTTETNKTSSSFNSTLPALSLSHLRPYIWEADLEQASNPPALLSHHQYHPPAPVPHHFYAPPPPAPAPHHFQAPPHHNYYAQPSAPVPSQAHPPPPPPVSTPASSLASPYLPDYNALMEVAAKKPTTTALARDCFEVIFEHEIRDGLFQFGQYNLYGRTMRGSNDRKFPLDSGKVHALRAFVEDKLPQGCNKETEWHKCVDAIHRRIGELKTK